MAIGLRSTMQKIDTAFLLNFSRLTQLFICSFAHLHNSTLAHSPIFALLKCVYEVLQLNH